VGSCRGESGSPPVARRGDAAIAAAPPKVGEVVGNNLFPSTPGPQICRSMPPVSLSTHVSFQLMLTERPPKRRVLPTHRAYDFGQG
jgi:hypothetical protein